MVNLVYIVTRVLTVGDIVEEGESVGRVDGALLDGAEDTGCCVGCQSRISTDSCVS